MHLAWKILFFSLLTVQIFAQSKNREVEMAEKDLAKIFTLKFDRTNSYATQFWGPLKSGRLDPQRMQKYLGQIRYSSSICPQGSTACADPRHGDIYLTAKYFASNEAERMSILVHELRHLEPEEWLHVDCANPFIFLQPDIQTGRIQKFHIKHMDGLKDQCDGSDLGAYAAQVTFASMIIDNCTNCSRKLREEANEGLIPHFYRLQISPKSLTKFIKENGLEFTPN